jgi:hypothetical protein
MKPLAIVLSGAGRELSESGVDDKGDLTNIHCKAIGNWLNESP